jgi:hypothetical protein
MNREKLRRTSRASRALSAGVDPSPRMRRAFESRFDRRPGNER